MEVAERPRSIEELTNEDVLCAIRQVFSDGAEREREDAIRDVARLLGYQRTGINIWNDIDTCLTMASKWRIVETHGGMISRCTRIIDDYDRDFLKKTILSVLGTVWWDREDAIRVAAWSLGFSRTGPNIHQAFKSALSGLIRSGDVEREGDRIRRF